MSWNGDGHGPGSTGPWGGRRPEGDEPKRPEDGRPPNIEDILRQGRERVRRMMGGGNGGGGGRNSGFGASWREGGWLAGLVAGVLVLLWLGTGIYRVQPDEQGVVLRFGAYLDTTQPGLHYHLPTPIEQVIRPKVTRINRTEIGIAGQDDEENIPGSASTIPAESLMLTGDENIVDINLSVFWSIKDAKAYLFNIRNPDDTVKSAAESAIREVVGRTPIASVLAEGRTKVEQDTAKLLQETLDSYQSGIAIAQVQLQKVDPPQPVIEAFRDVQRARADEERAKNEAEAYRNDVVPRARGDAERIIQEAEAYRQAVVARAQGDGQRFSSVLSAYQGAKAVTAERLYLETMEDVIAKANRIVIDRSATGVVPYLPLPSLGSRTALPPKPAGSVAQAPAAQAPAASAMVQPPSFQPPSFQQGAAQ